jgi:ketosteroid isomerase-like protein
MSQENVALAEQVMDALGRRDLDSLNRLADEGVEWRSFFAELGQGGVYRGRDGTRQYMSDLDVETETAAGWMLKFSKGKLMRFRAFRAPEEALEAVGLEA